MSDIEQSFSERRSAMKALQTLIDYARAEAADQNMPMLAHFAADGARGTEAKRAA
jgi:hypothetical protein